MQDTSVTLDRWFWGQQGAEQEEGMLEIGGGVEGVCEGCLHTLEREKCGILWGLEGWMTDEEDNNGKQLCVNERGEEDEIGRV